MVIKISPFKEVIYTNGMILKKTPRYEIVKFFNNEKGKQLKRIYEKLEGVKR